MNGVASEARLADELGAGRVIYANAYMVAVRDGHAVTWRDIGRIVFGEKRNVPVSPRVNVIRALFDKTAIPCPVPDGMLRAHWGKFMLNVGINQALAVLKAPYGTFQSDPHVRDLMISAAREVVEISQRVEVGVEQNDIAKFQEIIDSLDLAGKTSMLQDIEGNRETEVDVFASMIVELGKRFGVATPVTTPFQPTRP